MTFSLAVEPRSERGKKLTSLRNAGKLPAVMYGPKDEVTALSVDARAFEKVLKGAGESSIVTLTGLDTPKDVLIHDVAFDARRGGVIHADFYAIDLLRDAFQKVFSYLKPPLFAGRIADAQSTFPHHVLHDKARQ